MWIRVFGQSDVMPQPAELQQRFGWGGIAVRGDDLGWTSLEVSLDPGRLRIERFLSEADDIRDDLDTWAAWLEQYEQDPHRVKLMQHVISTRQLFTIQTDLDASGEEIAKYLSQRIGGIYQVDGRGFHAADGMLLVGEN